MNEIHLIGGDKSRLFENEFSNSLVLTYGIDLIFYENFVLNELKSNNNIILADKNQLLLAQDSQYKLIKKDSSRYIFYPVSTGSIFHPKAILLTDNKISKLFIGSGNMTFGGMSNNKELYAEFSTSNEKDKPIFIEFKNFVNNLMLRQKFNLFTERRINKVFDVESYNNLVDIDNSREIFFIHNLEISIINHIESYIKGTKKIYIISPFFDKNLATLNYLKETFQENISVFFQPTYTNFNAENYKDDYKLFSYPGDSRNLHAKLIIFEYEDTIDILFGSPNCTKAALIEKAGPGNVECAVFLRNIDKTLIKNYIPQEKNVIDLNSISPIQTSDNSLYNFILNRASLTTSGELIIEFNKNTSQVDDLKIFINDELIDGIEYEKHFIDEKLIIRNYSTDKIIYLYVKLNGLRSNTIIVQNEQKTISNNDPRDTKNINKSTNYYDEDSLSSWMEDIDFFDPFRIITREKMHIHSNTPGRGGDVLEDDYPVKDRFKFYINISDIKKNIHTDGPDQGSDFNIFDSLVNFIPAKINIPESDNQIQITSGSSNDSILPHPPLPLRTPNELENEIIADKKLVQRLIENLDVLAKAYDYTKQENLNLGEFQSYYSDVVHILPFFIELMIGFKRKSKYDMVYDIPFNISTIHSLILPLLKTTMALLKSIKVKENSEWVKTNIPITYIQNQLVFFIIIFILLDYIYRNSEINELTRDNSNYIFFNTAIKLLETLNVLSIDLNNLMNDSGTIMGKFEKIIKHYQLHLKVKDEFNKFLLLKPLFNNLDNITSYRMNYIETSKNNTFPSFTQQLLSLIQA